MIYSQTNSNTGVLKLYGQVSEWWNNATDFTTTLTEMEAKFSTIQVRIHCYGGSVFEGSVIFNALASSKANIEIWIDGICASMASIIMLAGSKIYMAENAFVMIHNPSGYASGNAESHFSTAKLLKSMEKNFAKAYARKTGKAESDVQKWFDGNDHWFSAEDALSEGLITEIIAPIVANVVSLNKPEQSGSIETIYSKYAALLSDPTPATQKTVDTEMKKLILSRFALQGVTDASTDEAVMDALNKHFTALETQAQAHTNTAIEAVIAAAATARGKEFEEPTKAVLAQIGLKAGIQALQLCLGAPAAPAPEAAATLPAPVAPRLVSMINGNEVDAAANPKNWKWDEWQKNDPAGLEALEAKDFTTYSALYEAKYKTKPAV